MFYIQLRIIVLDLAISYIKTTMAKFVLVELRMNDYVVELL